MNNNRRKTNKRSGQTVAKRARKSRRNVVVLASLLGSLVLTSALLLVVAPAPLKPDDYRSLSAADQRQSLDLIFDTQVLIQPGRWQYIYVHHSKTRFGNALELGERTGDMGDHFLIGNGYGCGDGDIQVGQRWSLQQPARPDGGRQPLPQLAAIADRYISICLVGDFDETPPSAMQVYRLEQLVRTLQQKLGIRGSAILAFNRPGNAGIGQLFPAAEFTQRIQY